jgi:hypothetical protein
MNCSTSDYRYNPASGGGGEEGSKRRIDVQA